MCSEQSTDQRYPQSYTHEDTRNKHKRVEILNISIIVVLALTVRYCIGLYGYSGHDNAPAFGDYEAQRHWMEITLNTKRQQWYSISSEYWPLDYPPLSAYQVLGASLIQCNCLLRGSACYVAAFNHKHMALYVAPAFFAHLVGKCIQQPSFTQQLQLLSRIGFVVLASMALIWLPFVYPANVGVQILGRLTPVHRGLYEDYVANFWCATSPLFKWRRLFPSTTWTKLAASTTLLVLLPSHILEPRKPHARGLCALLVISSSSFFLFGFQVHEKNILYPLHCLILLSPWLDQSLNSYLPVLASFSCYPLLRRDGQILPYLACTLAYFIAYNLLIYQNNRQHKFQKEQQKTQSQVQVMSMGEGEGVFMGWQQQGQHRSWGSKGLGALRGVKIFNRMLGCSDYMAWLVAQGVGIGIMVCIHIARQVISPPTRYPWLFDAIMITYVFVQIAPLLGLVSWFQIIDP